MTETELKPCPFCGGEDFQIYTEGSVYVVKCGQCETKVGALDEKTAFEYWNARPIEDALRTENEKWRTKYSGAIIDDLEKENYHIGERNRLREENKRLREALEIYKEALHEGLWKTGLQDSIWEVIEQAEEKAEQILKGGEE